MLIGRKEELTKLKEAYESGYSEFIAVYGRRRVGKTFLIREAFNYNFTFSHTGISQKNTRAQLKEFHQSLKRHGAENSPVPVNWQEAFDSLISLLERSNDRRKVVFIDEMPWMDAPRSGFLPALEHFWNGWATSRRDILLIVCGSATSWIINKILKNHGGLHNRVSIRLHLKPFTLHECSGYAAAKKLTMSRMQIAEAYMIMGGIPYYLQMLQKGYSLSQNIDRMFFSENAEMRDEYGFLFRSLFKDASIYRNTVELLSRKAKGMTRAEMMSALKMPEGGNFSQVLDNLCNCDFIRKYSAFGKKERDVMYQLSDFYTLFFLKFVKGRTIHDEHLWSNMIDSPERRSWNGYSFEQLCLHHIPQIKSGLGISGIQSSVCSWSTTASEDHKGGQIDLVIDRRDQVINLCEMKFSSAQYEITKKYNDEMQERKELFRHTTRTRKALYLTMVTTYGLKPNMWSGMVQNEIVLDDLFREDR